MKKTISRANLDECLNSEPIINLNIKGMIENSSQDVLTNDKNTGVLIEDGYFSFLYSKDDQFLNAFLDKKKSTTFHGISGANKYVLDYMLEHDFVHWINPCHLMTLTAPQFTRKDIIKEIDSLKVEDAQFVTDHYEYSGPGSLEEIREAILKRPSSCVRIDNVPVSFALLHEDNSIGYMYTLEEHRHKGYAFEVTKDIVLKTIATSRVPYVHIIHWNHKSIALALKAGFEIKGDAYWFGLIDPLGAELLEDYKKYETHFSKQATHMSTRPMMRVNLSPLDVKVSDMKTHLLALYEDKEYRLDYYYDDEVYFLDIKQPIRNQLLRSILVDFIKLEENICVLDLSDIENKEGFFNILGKK